MKKIAGYILSPLMLLVLILLLLIFHLVQVICRFIGGYPLRKKSVDILCFSLVYSQYIMGARIKWEGFEHLPDNRPFIIVSNHQSFMDIPPIIWGFRKHHPKFVAKKELGKGIPSISYNLKHGGSVLIDRDKGRQSIIEIGKLGKHIEENNYSASIFPEGTRSKTGEIRKFQHAGIAMLMKSAPNALIVPLAIDGNDKFMVNGSFPFRFGVRLTYTVLPPIETQGKDAQELTELAEQQIRRVLGQEET